MHIALNPIILYYVKNNILYKKITSAATFIGALIGAGFASGREISLYFGHTSIFTPILAGILLGLFCYLFLLIGSVTDGSPDLLLKRGGKIIQFAIRICNAVTFCAMIAGSEEVIYSLFRFHGGSVITGILTLIVVVRGVEKIKFSNIVIVPVILIMIIILFVKEHTVPALEKISVIPAFVYCTMNIIGGGYLVSTFSAGFSKKDCMQTALICGVILTLLLLAVFFTVQNYLDDVMPLISAAQNNGYAAIGNIVMYLAIFTTLTSSLSIASANNKAVACILTAASFLVAVFGFRALVDKCYPIIGVVGGAISIIYLYLYLRYKNKLKGELQAYVKP